MKPRTAQLLSALLYLACTLGASRLARAPSDAAQTLAAILVAGALLGTGALIPTRTYSRPALLGAGAILGACTALPLAFLADGSEWLRDSPAVLGYFWLWMALLGMPLQRARAWCTSGRTLLIASALLGGAGVATALW